MRGLGWNGELWTIDRDASSGPVTDGPQIAEILSSDRLFGALEKCHHGIMRHVINILVSRPGIHGFGDKLRIPIDGALDDGSLQIPQRVA